MDDPTLWALALGALCLVFGFVPLLLTRTYIDKDSNTATEIEIPFFGKLKSTYPALVFVLAGPAIVAYAINSHREIQINLVNSNAETERQRNAQKSAENVARLSATGDEDWVVTGRLKSADGRKVDWDRGVLSLFGGSPDVSFRPDGAFTIRLRLKRGVELEDYVQRIDYSNFESGSVTLYPKDELDKLLNKDKTGLLEAKSPLSRSYRPLQLQLFPK